MGNAIVTRQLRDKRCTPEGEERRYEVKTLSEKAREMVRLAVTGEYNNLEIAEILQCSKTNVSNTLNSPIVIEFMRELSAQRDQNFVKARKRLDEMLERAADVYEEALDGEDLDLKVKVADRIFDRSGLAKVTKIDTAPERGLTEADAIAIKERHKQLFGSGPIIDITPSSTDSIPEPEIKEA